MPLLVEGRRIDPARPLRELPRAFPELEEQAKQFRSQPAQAVGPKGLLYVQQREFAATTSKDGSVSILGSDDATTCHIVVLRHTGSGAICLTHCDGSDTETEVMLMINAVKVLSPSTDCGRLELHLIGGFCDDRRLSQCLTGQLLRAFDRLLDNVYLMTFCVTELNDRQENGRHLPYIYGIAANVKTGEIFHATFPDRGPDEDMRSARVLTGAKMISVYDSKKEQLCIGPYYWMPFPHVDFWLEQSNQSILQNLSTSPLAEPPHFVAHIRATLLYLREHPFPNKSLFPTQKPRLYKKKCRGLVGESLWPDLTQSRGMRSTPEVKNQGWLSRDLPCDIHIYLVSPTKTSGKTRVCGIYGAVFRPLLSPNTPFFSKTAIQFSAKLGKRLHLSWGWVQSSQEHKRASVLLQRRRRNPIVGPPILAPLSFLPFIVSSGPASK